MQRIFQHYIIQLLVVAIVGIGIAAPAGGDLCPPDCSHYVVANDTSSCCDNMCSNKATAPAPAERGPQFACVHGGYCDNSGVEKSALAVPRAVVSDITSIKPAIAALMQELPVRYHFFSLKPPSLWRQPAFYTLHCSLVI